MEVTAVLVLSRKKNESVVIGDRVITITIVDVRNGQVRLGFEAPEGVEIDRIEVWHAKKREQTGGANAS
jgi:carbon storage regulator